MKALIILMCNTLMNQMASIHASFHCDQQERTPGTSVVPLSHARTFGDVREGAGGQADLRCGLKAPSQF